MEFDKNRVYTSLNADELKIGSKVICADNLNDLKERVKGCDDIKIIGAILSDEYDNRFNCNYEDYNLAYLISEPEEKKLKWTDLKVKDVIKYRKGKEQAEVIYINEEGIGGSDGCHICIGRYGTITDYELEDWEKVEE